MLTNFDIFKIIMILSSLPIIILDHNNTYVSQQMYIQRCKKKGMINSEPGSESYNRIEFKKIFEDKFNSSPQFSQIPETKSDKDIIKIFKELEEKIKKYYISLNEEGRKQLEIDTRGRFRKYRYLVEETKQEKYLFHYIQLPCQKWNEEEPQFKYLGANLNSKYALIFAFIFHDLIFVVLNQLLIPEEIFGKKYSKVNSIIKYGYSILSVLALWGGHSWGCSWNNKYMREDYHCDDSSETCKEYLNKGVYSKLCEYIDWKNNKHIPPTLMPILTVMRISSILFVSYFIYKDVASVTGKLSRSEQRKLHINNSEKRSKVHVGLFTVAITSVLISIYLRNKNFVNIIP